MNTFLSTLIKLLGSQLLQIVAQIAAGTMGKVVERATVLAQEIVRDLDASMLTGADKRAAALERLRARLAQEGKEVSAWVLNFAIETAVAGVRQALEATAPPK